MSANILIVDDEPTMRLLARRLLHKAGLEADLAGSVSEAIARLEQGEYEVAVIDLYLPDSSGFALLDWLREHRPDTVAVVLSGTTVLQDVIAAMQRGAFDFVTKPLVDEAVFVEQIRRAVAQRRLQDSHARLLRQTQEQNVLIENRLSQLELAHSLLQSQALAIQNDLNRAQSIQQGLLPRELPFWQRLSLALLYRPASKVGGDFCDIFRLGAHHLGCYVADASGHGVSSALVTMFLKYSVQPLETEDDRTRFLEPGQLLRSLNHLLAEQPFSDQLFVSFAYFVLDTETFELRYSNAGHPPLCIRHEGGRIEEVRSPAPALGINPNVKYGTVTRRLRPRDTLILYSDGVTDVENEASEFFGRERFHALLSGGPDSPAELVAAIDRELLAFGGGTPFHDDATVAALRLAPQETPAISVQPPPCLRGAEAPLIGTRLVSAREDGCILVGVVGSGTWRESRQLMNLFESSRGGEDVRIIIDFSHCTHLDSTFLGVLHNLCSESEKEPGVEIQIQNLPRPLLKEMSELGLTGVLLHFRSHPRSLPESMTAVPSETASGAEMGGFVLRAHEALVQADPRNADRFSAVLELLRRQAIRRPGGRRENGEGGV